MINSFGAGGTCVNIIIEEFLPAVSPVKPSIRKTEAALLLFSAKTEKSLRSYLAAFAKHLQAHPELELHDVAKTLLRRNHALEFRACLVAESINETIRKLQYVETGESIEQPGVFISTGAVGNLADGEAAPSGNNLNEWAAHWINGNNSDLTHLFSATGPAAIDLPHYVFDHSQSFNFESDPKQPVRSAYEDVAQRIASGELSEDEFEKFMNA
jgi:polyketide synthase PksN